jgi:hypothetical protein
VERRSISDMICGGSELSVFRWLRGWLRLEALLRSVDAHSQGVGDLLAVGSLLSKTADPAGQVGFHLSGASS